MRLLHTRLLAALVLACTFSCAGEPTPPPAPPPLMSPASAASASGAALPVPSAPMNALLDVSPLPYQAPPFDRIHDADYQPAIEEGIARHMAEVEKIAAQTEPPTFENTVVALERSGALLTRATKVFFGVAHANTNDTLQKVEEAVAPKLAAHQDAIYLDEKLYARVKALYDHRDGL
ncbi:MAG TPA: hypothetical protein VIY73_12980, partial [Polyangiaceae bacterium]